jgi:ligand-binding sensor domain-containing protein
MQFGYFIRRLISNVLLLVVSCLALAGNPPFLRKISFLEGLPSPTIYDMFSAQKGFIYLGTNKGLVRFNGAEFLTIHFSGNYAKSINNLCENEQGTIWCKNFSNQVFYLKDNQLYLNESLQHYIDQSGNLREMIMVKNTLWLMTQYEVFTFNTLSGDIEQKFMLDKEMYENTCVDIHYAAKTGSIYLADLKHVYAFKNNQFEVEYVLSKNEQTTLMSFQGDIYLTAKNFEMRCRNLTQKKDVNLPDELNNSYFNYLRTSSNNLWLCTNKGLLLMDTENNQNAVLMLKNRRISDVIEDFQGNIWISTLDEGLFLLPSIDLKYHDVDSKQEHRTPVNLLHIEHGPENTFFVGSSLGQIIWYRANGQVIQTFETGYNNEIEFLYYDETQQTLLHTFGVIDLKSKKIAQSVILGKCIYPDDRGNYVVCNYALAGIIPADFNGEVNFSNINQPYKREIYSPIGIDMLVLRKMRSRCAIYSSTQQKYYIAYSDGVWMYDKLGNAVPIFDSHDPVIAHSMSLDENGRVWIATMHHGILQVEHGKVLVTLDEKSGLTNNDCKKIIY